MNSAYATDLDDGIIINYTIITILQLYSSFRYIDISDNLMNILKHINITTNNNNPSHACRMDPTSGGDHNPHNMAKWVGDGPFE